MRYSIFFTFLLFISGHQLYPNNFSDSVRLEEQGDKKFVIHQVDPGETLYSLSKRYDSEIEAIRSTNSIRGNSLEVGQVLRIPYQLNESKSDNSSGESKGVHIVQKGETLFSISQLYETSIEDLKKWNALTSNEISVGQRLIVKSNPAGSVKKDDKPMYTYYVRTGETLVSIAKKFDVPEDSIVQWNQLKKRKLSPGQSLIFPFELPDDTIEKVTSVSRYDNTNYGSKMRSEEEGGVAKIVEEGLAKKIDEDLNTTKFLALHRSLRIGTIFQVKNLMNNERIYVRVVGKLPDTGINENVMIRLTPISFEKLGILDDKALVEITYFKQ